jgi:hypothetical protein
MAGRAVGPNFESPAPPPITSLSATPEHTSPVGGPAQRAYVHGLDIPPRLVGALALPSAQHDACARHRCKRCTSKRQSPRCALLSPIPARRGTFAPQVSASLGPTRQKQSAAQAKLSGGAPHPIQFPRRRFPYPILPSLASIGEKVEALAAQAEAQHFELEATYLTLTSKLVLAAIQEASLRDEIAAAEHSISVAQEVLTLIGKQLDTHESTRP